MGKCISECPRMSGQVGAGTLPPPCDHRTWSAVDWGHRSWLLWPENDF